MAHITFMWFATHLFRVYALNYLNRPKPPKQVMMHRRRHYRRGRRPTPILITHKPKAKAFNPEPPSSEEPIRLDPAELEAIRLTDLMGLCQRDAGEAMGVSRGTVWRLLQSGRSKVALALVEGRRLEILEPTPPTNVKNGEG